MLLIVELVLRYLLQCGACCLTYRLVCKTTKSIIPVEYLCKRYLKKYFCLLSIYPQRQGIPSLSTYGKLFHFVSCLSQYEVINNECNYRIPTNVVFSLLGIPLFSTGTIIYKTPEPRNIMNFICHELFYKIYQIVFILENDTRLIITRTFKTSASGKKKSLSIKVSVSGFIYNTTLEL